MMPNLNLKTSLKRFWYGLLPPIRHSMILWCVTLVLCILIPAISRPVCVFFVCAYAVAIVRILFKTVQPVTAFFSVVRLPGMRRAIVAQHRGHPLHDCRATVRALALEGRILADALPLGTYQAVTHETVWRRIQADDTLHVIVCKRLGQGTLKSIWKRIGQTQCKHCPQNKNCRIRRMIHAPRQFYYIVFEKM